MEGPMMEARALTPLISCSFLHSFPAFFSHHHHHPCLATSSISFLGGIGIALFSSSSQCRLLSTVTLLLEYLPPSCRHVGANQLNPPNRFPVEPIKREPDSGVYPQKTYVTSDAQYN